MKDLYGNEILETVLRTETFTEAFCFISELHRVQENENTKIEATARSSEKRSRSRDIECRLNDSQSRSSEIQ